MPVASFQLPVSREEAVTGNWKLGTGNWQLTVSNVQMFTIGVFQNVEWADRGIGALIDAGFDRASMSVLAKDSDAADALVTARFGGAPSRFEIERLGTVIARGPLLGVLQGSDGALESKGLASVCNRADFQAHDGHIFETPVNRGGVLVAVHNLPRASDALAKLHAYGGGNAAIGAWSGRV